MPYRPTPHIHIAFPAEHAIILDTAADRYWRVGRTKSSWLRTMATGGSIDHAVVAGMMRDGILVETDWTTPWHQLAAPTLRSSFPATSSGRGGVVLGLVALGRALITVRLFGLQAALDGARRRAANLAPPDPKRAASIANEQRLARRWFPWRTFCLIDSLALHDRLCACKIGCNLVIGVRDQPFAAHCWVESGAVLLNDELDTVCELTPILRL